MSKRLKHLLLALLALSAPAALLAQEKAAEGTLTLNKKTYQLSQGVAYEGTFNGDDATVVVLSNQPITAHELNEARAAEKKGDSPDFKRPYLKLVFKKSGELTQ